MLPMLFCTAACMCIALGLCGPTFTTEAGAACSQSIKAGAAVYALLQPSVSPTTALPSVVVRAASDRTFRCCPCFPCCCHLLCS